MEKNINLPQGYFLASNGELLHVVNPPRLAPQSAVETWQQERDEYLRGCEKPELIEEREVMAALALGETVEVIQLSDEEIAA